MPNRLLHSIPCIVLGFAVGVSAIAQGRGPREAGPTTLPANYRGPTTSNSYEPLAVDNTTGAVVAQAAVHVEPISARLRSGFQIPPFYAKSLTVDGIPIIGSDKVSDYAVLECAYTIDRMLMNSPPSVKQALIASKVRVGVIAVVEYTMDIPENRTPGNLAPSRAAFQDRRSRGLGGQPLATCAEENLLNLDSDPYFDENITIHEFSHTIASAIRIANPGWYDRLRETYKQAMKEGLFPHSYSATNEQEYWAEGAQAWFDCASRRKDQRVHSGIWYREQLRSYDPRLAELLKEVYGDGDWRYVRTTNKPLLVERTYYLRPPAELKHLAGLNRSALPEFDFELSPRIQAAAQAAGANPSPN